MAPACRQISPHYRAEGKAAMVDRGVIYMVWGCSDKVERALERSRRSLAAVHPELPSEVIRVDADNPVKGLLEKAGMMQYTPFRETLFLDADTVVLDRLDYGFQRAQKFGLACCICECPWARRYPILRGDVIEYNTGVLFFNEMAKPVFDAWSKLAGEADSSLLLVQNGKVAKMPHNDQCSFAMAIDQTGFSPFVLPLNWNFRPEWHLSFFGPLKIWHDYHDVPSFFYELLKYYNNNNAIIQYHAVLPAIQSR
jgi:hypothetical protein